jgi:hypothetical protein
VDGILIPELGLSLIKLGYKLQFQEFRFLNLFLLLSNGIILQLLLNVGDFLLRRSLMLNLSDYNLLCDFGHGILQHLPFLSFVDD